MGNDGGSILGRRDLVKEKEKESTTSKLFDLKDLDHVDLWTTCALTGAKLDYHQPIVSDWQGRLYSKEAILEWLLDKSHFTEAQARLVSHISSLKDVVELQIALNDKDQWVCPLTHKLVVTESTTRPFIYIVPCGHFMSEVAFKEFNKCPECSAVDSTKEVPAAFDSDIRVVPVNSKSGQVQQNLKNRIDKLTRNNQSHALKVLKPKRKDKLKTGQSGKRSLNSSIKAEPAAKRKKTLVQ